MTPPLFFASLGIASGMCVLAALALGWLLGRLAPAYLRGLQGLAFAMILASGLEAASLLFSPDAYEDPRAVLSRVVLVLVAGLALRWAVMRQLKRKNEKA